jgi:hypothetical protein
MVNSDEVSRWVESTRRSQGLRCNFGSEPSFLKSDLDFSVAVLVTFERGIQATGSSTPHINSNMTEASPEAGPSTPRIPQQTTPDEPSSAFERWRSSLAAFTGLGMSEEQKLEQAALNENKKLEKDWNACEKLKQDLMETSEFSRSCTVPPSHSRLAHSPTHSLFFHSSQARPY